jgi:hypothetical protein
MFGIFKKRQVVKVVVVNAIYENGIMTVTYSNDTVRKYRGNSTVWYELPLMERCHTSTESKLSDIQVYINHSGNPYPDSHLKPVE